MSKNERRAKANKRVTADKRARTEALCWPDVLWRFSDWLIETNCLADALAAYSTAMAVDRSARERDLVVVDAEFPLELFDVEDYTAYCVDDCGHLPWTLDDLAEAMGLFANFVVAKRISPTQTAMIADDITPLHPLRATPVSARLSTPIGPIALTSHLQQVACWLEDNGSVPGSCLGHPNISAGIRGKLNLEHDGGLDAVSEFMSKIKYRVVIATALGIDLLTGSGRSHAGGTEFESWLRTPTQDQLHRMLVEAYSACLKPIVDFDDTQIKLEVAASAAALWFTLVRSLVDDPFRDGDLMSTGTGTDSKNVGLWMTLRFTTMIELGLVVSVNGMFCVPDAHVPALLEALDRNRMRRAGVAA